MQRAGTSEGFGNSSKSLSSRQIVLFFVMTLIDSSLDEAEDGSTTLLFIGFLGFLRIGSP